MNPHKTALVFGLICTASLLYAAEESVAHVEQEPFPIVCVLGPSANDNRIEHWQRIRDANFTVVLPSFQYDDSDLLKMLNYCQQIGIKGIVHARRLAPPGSSDSPPADWRQRAAEVVERYSDHPALFSYMVRDEPGADLFPQLGRIVREFERLDPRHPVSINLFPVHATEEQLQSTTYVEHLERFLQIVKPPFLTYLKPGRVFR